MLQIYAIVQCNDYGSRVHEDFSAVKDKVKPALIASGSSGRLIVSESRCIFFMFDMLL